MPIKSKLKSAVFQILDVLPDSWGYAIYHELQKKTDTLGLQGKIGLAQNTFNQFLKISKELNIEIAGKKLVEIGSGWLPLMPYFFKYHGKVACIDTYDLNKHYDAKQIAKLNNYFSREFELDICNKGSYNLPKVINYYPETDLTKVSQIEPDIVFSRFVLEHVNPEDLKLMHQKFRREMHPGSHIVHFISPSDHRAYTDKNLSLQDFLRFSEDEWKARCTKFDYHNRWRLPQYVALFEELGFKIVYLDYDVTAKNSITWEKFQKVNIHPDFQKHTDAELMAGSINLILKL